MSIPPLERGSERESYLVEDDRVARMYEIFLQHTPHPTPEQSLRWRYALAKHEIGEPPLKSIAQIQREIAGMVEARWGERAEGHSAHRSDVSIVFNHQDLWGLTGDELHRAILQKLLPIELYPAAHAAFEKGRGKQEQQAA